jgi:formate dehydrogenase major subunit
MPNVYSGYQKVDDEEVRAKFEAAWGVTLPTRPGKDNHEMIDAIIEGSLKALYIKGEDTITSDSNANYVAEAFSRLDFFVVQDINFSATCAYADLVLPAAASLEKDGTFVSTERRIQRIYKALEPLGESKADWEILQLIANRLGANWKYKHPSDVMDEIASVTPLFAGVTYERLEGFKSLQWPVAADGTDTPLLFKEEFHFPDGKARFYPIQYIPSSEERNETFDLHLNNGRLLEHFEQGSMTGRTPGIHAMTPNNFVEVSPELAKERGIGTGTHVLLASAYGEARLQGLVTDRVQGKQLYMPLNSITEPVNRLTSSHTDRATHTPAYKETAVSMTILPNPSASEEKSPLPRRNFRFGKRTPQSGVEIERKWARPDYYLPGTKESDRLVQIETTRV